MLQIALKKCVSLGEICRMAKYQLRFIGWIHLIYMLKIRQWQSGVLYVDELLHRLRDLMKKWANVRLMTVCS